MRSQVFMTKTAQLNEISDKFKEMEILAYSMCVTKSTNDRASMLEQSAATKEEINSLLEQLDQMAVTEDEKSRVKNITAYYQGFTDAYQKVTDSIENGNKTQAQEYCNLELFKAANKLSDELASYIEFYNADVDRVVANQSTVYDSGNYANLIVIGLIVVSLIASLYITIFKVVRPIRKTSKELKVIVKDMQSGHADLTKRVTVKGNDEISELCQSFEQMREQLKQSSEERVLNEKENRELISNISHDLKTPITAIKGYVEGIMDGVADTPEKMEKYVRTIYNKTNEMDLLINELTIYSKIDTNRIPYNFSKINVAEYFEDCVEEIGMDLDSKGIGLSYINYAEDDIVVIMDPEQIRRVIHNIISNSVKYLDKQNGFINIRVRDVGDFVQFEFEDNGRGIAAKDLPYIFERFYRAEKSRNSATGGSGIGLSIVKKIIEDHGGKIWATSKESSGTTMYFVIRKYQEVPNEQNIDH